MFGDLTLHVIRQMLMQPSNNQTRVCANTRGDLHVASAISLIAAHGSSLEDYIPQLRSNDGPARCQIDLVSAVTNPVLP